MRKFRDMMEKRFTKAKIAEIDRWVADESVKINLAKIRDLAGITQIEMAKRLEISQSSVARTEAQGDSKVSTLRRYVEALGGELEVRAVIADKSVKLHV